MKILQFRRTEKNDKYEYGEILVKRFFFFKQTLGIFKSVYGINWKFEKTGAWTTGHQVERLAAAYDAKESKK